jgi:hypothetical protein
LPDVTVPVNTGPVVPNPNEQNSANIINTVSSGLEDIFNFPNKLNQIVYPNINDPFIGDPNYINPATNLPYPEFKEQPMGILETNYPFKY